MLSFKQILWIYTLRASDKWKKVKLCPWPLTSISIYKMGVMPGLLRWFKLNNIRKASRHSERGSDRIPQRSSTWWGLSGECSDCTEQSRPLRYAGTMLRPSSGVLGSPDSGARASSAPRDTRGITLSKTGDKKILNKYINKKPPRLRKLAITVL